MLHCWRDEEHSVIIFEFLFSLVFQIVFDDEDGGFAGFERESVLPGPWSDLGFCDFEVCLLDGVGDQFVIDDFHQVLWGREFDGGCGEDEGK